MTINDGFGDLQPVEAPIEQWHAWLLREADRLVRRDNEVYDDLVQEGRIEFWRAWHKRPQDEEGDRLRISLASARYRMLGLITKRSQERTGQRASGAPAFTGAPSQQGRPEVRTLAVLDAPLPGSETTLIEVLLGAEDTLAGIEMAYHHGEIMRAIDALTEPHREYVVLRFWGGWTDTEIAARQGLSSSKVLYNHWSRTIRPALLERLGHLVSA